MAAHAGSPPGPGMSRQRRQSWPRLDPDTAEYFRRALETLEEGLSEEELALFTPNVLSELAHHLPAVALDPGGSRLLLLLLPQAPPTTLPHLLLHLGRVPRHPRGSRVLEAALGRVLGVLREGLGVGEDLQGALGGLARLFLEDLGGLARDPNGSFVLRALLAVLGGGRDEVPPPKGAEPKAKGAELKAKGAWSLPEGAELPASFRPLLEELAQGLEQQIPALLSPACASLCLQGALGALRRSQSPSCARFCRALIGCLRQTGPAHQHSPLLTSLQDPAHSRLLEAAMTALDPPGLRELFRGHLRGHLRGVASHPVANHGLQRLLDHAPEDVVEEVLSELGPALEEPLARGHPGVVLALLGAALRHPRLQGEVLRWLFQALRCWAPPHHPHCVAALAKLRPLEGGASTEGAELQPSPAGSRALQLLLRFRCTGPAPMEKGHAHIDTGHVPNGTGHAPNETGHAPSTLGHTPRKRRKLRGHAPNETGHAPNEPNHAPCIAHNETGHAPNETDHAPTGPGHAPSIIPNETDHAPRKRRKSPGHAPSIIGHAPSITPNETGPAPYAPGHAPSVPGHAPSITPNGPGHAPNERGHTPRKKRKSGGHAPTATGHAPSITPNVPGHAPNETGHAPSITPNGPGHAPNETGHSPNAPGHAPSITPNNPGHAPNAPGHAPRKKRKSAGHAPSITPNGPGHAPNETSHAPNAPGHAPRKKCKSAGHAPSTTPNGPGHAPKAPGHAPNETSHAPFAAGPAPVAAALAALSGAALAALARGGPGSRLCDAILGCGAARKWLLGRLQGQWAGLARDRFGSRVLDTAWASGDARQRARLATELAPHLPALLRDPFGRGVARNFSLELFRRDRPGWERLQRGAGPKGRGLSL